MSTIAKLPQSAKILITILSGPDAGVAWELDNGKYSIGRDPDNGISLNDPKVSRKHAEIEINGDQIIVRDLESKTGIKVDGKPCKMAHLMPGSRIALGTTEFQLNLNTASHPVKEPTFFSLPSDFTAHAAPAPTASTPQSPMSFQFPQAKNKRAVYIGVGIVVLLLILANLGKKDSKKIKEGIRSESQIQEEIDAIQRRKELLEQEKALSGAFSRQYAEAQSSYIKCFRDYREGNYGRAIQNCTAALAIYPEHLLAQKYRRLSERKLDEVIQYSMFEGRRYMEQNKYDLAQAAYRNILIMVNDPSSKTYQEAQERLKEIQLLLRGRY